MLDFKGKKVLLLYLDPVSWNWALKTYLRGSIFRTQNCSLMHDVLISNEKIVLGTEFFHVTIFIHIIRVLYKNYNNILICKAVERSYLWSSTLNSVRHVFGAKSFLTEKLSAAFSQNLLFSDFVRYLVTSENFGFELWLVLEIRAWRTERDGRNVTDGIPENLKFSIF